MKATIKEEKHMRKFEMIKQEELAKLGYSVPNNYLLPQRGSSHSAGYDFRTPFDITIKAHESYVVPTLCKASMENDEVLLIIIRSSMAMKRHITLTNQVGVIDSDYYSNPDNDGHIMISLTNNSDSDITLKSGERIAQGIFVKYNITDDDNNTEQRMGGIGSTGK